MTAEARANHDTLCQLTSLLLNGRGGWTKDELVAAVTALRADLAAAVGERDALRKASTAALGFIENLHVPQNVADAGIQIMLQGAPVLEALRAALRPAGDQAKGGGA